MHKNFRKLGTIARNFKFSFLLSSGSDNLSLIMKEYKITNTKIEEDSVNEKDPIRLWYSANGQEHIAKTIKVFCTIRIVSQIGSNKFIRACQIIIDTRKIERDGETGSTYKIIFSIKDTNYIPFLISFLLYQICFLFDRTQKTNDVKVLDKNGSIVSDKNIYSL